MRAAIVEPWSNGQTEGQVTRLKLVKRQMYGRANVDLLRARMVQLVHRPIQKVQGIPCVVLLETVHLLSASLH